jgi:hypothetical protein
MPARDEGTRPILKEHMQFLVERHEELEKIEIEDAITWKDRVRSWLDSWRTEFI